MAHADELHDEKPWRDEETMRALYVDEELSTYKIGERLGCSYQTAHDWLEKHGIDTRDSPKQKCEKERPPKSELEEKYNSGMTTKDLGEEYGVRQQRAWKWLEQYDIPRRAPAHAVEGEESYRWKEDTASYTYSPKFLENRKKAIKRDGEECARCGMSREEHIEKIGSDITVHHIKKRREFDDREESHDLENLITLCRPCHSAIDNYGITLDVRHKQSEGGA